MRTQPKPVNPYIFPFLNRSVQLSILKKVKVAGYIVKVVCEYYHMNEMKMRSPERTAGVAECRHMIVGLLQEYTLLTETEIGVLIGNRHRATVRNSIKVFHDFLQSDKEFKRKYEELLKTI